MSNKDKRAKRAKLKAKASRVQKHKEKLNSVRPATNVVKMSPKFIEFFKTLPDFSKKYECVPFLRAFVENSQGDFPYDDLEFGVAMLFVNYGHWSTTGSDSIEQTELLHATNFILEKTEFLDSFNSLVAQ